MTPRVKHILLCAGWCLAYVVAAGVVVWLVSQNGEYARGSDTLFHLQKGQELYQSISQGVLWPLYDSTWYNGVEPLRFWSPLPVYVLATLCALAGGSLAGEYLLFVGVVLVLGGICWLIIGMLEERPVLCGFVGLIWFFMPPNIAVLFVEGNLPRVLIVSLLPLFVYGMYCYLRKRDWRLLPALAVGYSCIVLTHVGYAYLIGGASLVYLVAHGIACRSWRPQAAVLATFVCGVGISGFWFLPALQGGYMSTDSTDIVVGFFQDLLITVNPLERLATNFEAWYFGLAAFACALFGAICAGKKQLPLFWSGIVVLLLTTTAAFPFMSKMPGGQYLWMLRALSIGLTLVMVGFFCWKSLKKWLVVLVCVLLVVDAVPSLPLVYGNGDGRSLEERYTLTTEAWLLDEAKMATDQRLAFFEDARLGSLGAYLSSSFSGTTNNTFGAGYQAASTYANVSRISRAYDIQNFLYLFDRALELGNDTVLVWKSLLKPATGVDLNVQMDVAANRLGYTCIADNGSFRLYDLQGQQGTWGTVSVYPAIAIGSSAATLALDFPCLQETTDTNLNHYSFDLLSQYQVVYLCDFTYDDQATAESLVRQLGEAGVRVVISADGIPEQPNSHDRAFLGVRCNSIIFSNGYPELDTVDGRLNCDLFPSEFADNWNTVYLDGLDQVWGIVSELDGKGTSFDFYGTAANDNIVFIGLNLAYHYALTGDEAVGSLLGHAMELKNSTLPKREIVPVSVSYQPDCIVIDSAADNVNTALAWHDVFSSEQDIWCLNSLLYVNSGQTVVALHYPMPIPAFAMSLAGIALLLALCWLVRRLPPRRCKVAEVQSEDVGGFEKEQGLLG